jgi:hypothetical protein
MGRERLGTPGTYLLYAGTYGGDIGGGGLSACGCDCCHC